MGDNDNLRVFSGNANRLLAQVICTHLGIALGDAAVGRFPDSEVSVHLGENIRGKDVFVVQSTCPPVNDNVMELLIMIDCFRRASARRITAVIPYFGYARQDRKDDSRVPISAKLVANLITIAGADRVVTIDLHSGQIQGFFDIPVDHLYAGPALRAHLRTVLPVERLVVVGPDVGAIKLARAHAKRLGAGLAIVDKRRVSGRETKEGFVIGDVKGKVALLADDMISTGGSIIRAAETVLARGALEAYLAATHPVFCEDALARLEAAPVTRVFVTDTIPLARRSEKVVVVSVVELLANAIACIHRDESVSALFAECIAGEEETHVIVRPPAAQA